MEEHFVDPRVRDATSSSEWTRRTRELGERGLRLGTAVLDRLEDVDKARLAAMDAAGIDMQVLSHTQPGVEDLDADVAVRLARGANDLLGHFIARHPGRFAGLAMLPTPAPERAADELERAVKEIGLKGALVNGRTGGRFLDDRFFWPFFERAEQLGVPVYVHPGVPPSTVREASYEGLSPAASHWLAVAAWGWHVDTGLHALRLMAAGLFDRFPKLQVILGHMGEALPFMLARTNMTLSRRVTGLEREVRDYFTLNFHVTTSGFFTNGPLLCLLDTMPVDRVMFAVDYPYSNNEEGRAFLDAAPLSAADREKVAHANAERLLSL